MEEIVFHQHMWPLEPRSSEFSPAIDSRDRILASHSHQNSLYDLAPSVLILWNQCSQQVGVVFVPPTHVVAQIYPNSSLWDAYGLAPVEELILMIDPLVESDEDGLYRVRTFTPENVCPFSCPSSHSFYSHSTPQPRSLLTEYSVPSLHILR